MHWDLRYPMIFKLVGLAYVSPKRSVLIFDMLANRSPTLMLSLAMTCLSSSLTADFCNTRCVPWLLVPLIPGYIFSRWFLFRRPSTRDTILARGVDFSLKDRKFARALALRTQDVRVWCCFCFVLCFRSLWKSIRCQAEVTPCNLLVES